MTPDNAHKQHFLSTIRIARDVVFDVDYVGVIIILLFVSYADIES